MFTKVLSPKTAAALSLLAKSNLFGMAYLAGGTAIALQLGHRLSVDLDFFSPNPFSADELTHELKKISAFHPRLSISHTLLGKLNGVDFSLLLYQYPLIKKTISFERLKLASLEDIAAMKMAAISDRGTKRDFIDLYFLLKKFSLSDLFKFYDKKYQKLEVNLYHLFKSLIFFADAEDNKMPEMFIKTSWREVKTFIKETVLAEKEKYFK